MSDGDGDGGARPFGLSHELGSVEGFPNALLVSQALAEGLDELAVDRWPTSARELPSEGRVLARVRQEGMETVLVERDGLLVEIGLMTGFVGVAVAGRERDRVDAAVAELRERFPAPDPSARHEVPVTFWTYSPHGSHPVWRAIAVPEWDEIEENYEAGTRDGLVPLMRDFRPARGGQLVLWHGEAGTGKTYALRALAWEWRSWCEFHYIVDPDRFFGEHADYLMNVLLQPGYDMDPEYDLESDADSMLVELGPGGDEGIAVPRSRGGWAPAPLGGGRKPWKLLMLEDTGELLTPDARSVIGQGLSRFLNVVDGLIGQGLRVLVLVTTNEEIRKLHPAVARPGRAAANVVFSRLAAAEANAWLERHGAAARVEGPTTLAALYALADGADPGKRDVAAGFGG